MNQMFSPRSVPSPKSQRALLRLLHKAPPPDISFTADDILAAIKKTKVSKALGPDGLAPIHLRHIGPKVAAYLAALFNLSLATSIIPDRWRQSIIIPLVKAGKDPSLAASYRPIALLSPLAKILERLLHPILTSAADLSSHQHGFRSGRGTTTALFELSDAILEGLNQQKPASRTVAVSIDLSRAFDCVRHDQLLQDLVSLNLPTGLVRWFAAYIRGRHDRVLFRGALSKPRKQTCSVPQGSVLSPTLFNIYMRDLPLPPAPAKVVSYADDVTFFSQHNHIDQAAQLLSEFMPDVVDFFTQRGLTISAAKSSVTVFTLDPKEFNRHPAIIVNGAALPLLRKPKVLGVRFDPLFTFADHAREVAGKVSRCTKLLKALAGTSWGCAKETLATTFKALAKPHLTYAAPIWSPTISASSLRRLTPPSAQSRVATRCHPSIISMQRPLFCRSPPTTHCWASSFGGPVCNPVTQITTAASPPNLAAVFGRPSDLSTRKLWR